MNTINHISSSLPIAATPPTSKVQPMTPPAATAVTAQDRLELSGVNHLTAIQSSDVRADKVASVRAQLDAGTYETDAKLNIAIDKLLDELSR